MKVLVTCETGHFLSDDGWTDKENAMVFPQSAHAIRYCIAKGVRDVKVLFDFGYGDRWNFSMPILPKLKASPLARTGQ